MNRRNAIFTMAGAMLGGLAGLLPSSEFKWSGIFCQIPYRYRLGNKGQKIFYANLSPKTALKFLPDLEQICFQEHRVKWYSLSLCQGDLKWENVKIEWEYV